ncbi:MAG: hypothetical protein IT282_16845 [Bacteroidetes bacterium]|nr:hypothetical protein [Bacteroidota bacterium]
MRIPFCVFVLLAGPWLGPAWSVPIVELDHQREAQVVPERVTEQPFTCSKPSDSHVGDEAAGSSLGDVLEEPRQYPTRALTGEALPHPTRRMLINAHASSYL